MISQSKNKKGHPQNSELFDLTRKAIPRAFSTLLSMQLVCSGLAFSAVISSSLNAQADEASPAPSWNEAHSDSMSAMGAGAKSANIVEGKSADIAENKSELEAHTQPAKLEKSAEAEAKTESKTEAKAEVKTEVKPDAKAEITETKTEPSATAQAVETKVETKETLERKDSSVKSIAEIAPLANTVTNTITTTVSGDSALIAPGTVVPASLPAKNGDALAEPSLVNAVSPADTSITTVNSTNSTSTTSITNSINQSASESAVGLEAGSILSPDGKSLFGNESQAPKVGEGALNTVDSFTDDKMVELGATVVETGVNKDEVTADGEPLIVDSDQVSEVEESVKYENLPTDDGKTRIKTGARFPVVVTSQISSKNAHKGDGLEARLKYDLKIGDRLVARKGSAVQGHINYALPARSVMRSLMSSNRWYRNSGCLGVEFDEIVTDKGEHLPLVAAPAKNALIVKNKAEGRVLGVNHLGQIAGPWEQQLKYKAIRIGLNAAMAPAGVFSFGAMPVALGLIGAANPSFAFMKPVGTNVRHRRIKGFAWGFLSGLPGSWIIEDTVTKGNEAIIKPGDEFLVEFHQEFTGEPASEATMMPNANAKVHGDVKTSKKKSK